MSQAQFVSRGETVDYTPSSAVSAGDVVVQGSLVGVACTDIPAGTRGALAITGDVSLVVVSGGADVGDPIFWDSDGDPAGGVEGSGAATTDSTAGVYCGIATADSSGGRVRVSLGSRRSAVPVARADLGQETARVYAVPLTTWRVTGTGALLGATAGTPSGAFGLTVGTYGSASPLVVGEAANANSKTNKARFLFALPPEYVAGEAVSLRLSARITGDVEVAQTIDAAARVVAGNGTIGSDLVTTDAQTLTDAFAAYTFALTPTTLAPGDLLDIEVTGIADDTGGTANKLIQIGACQLLLTIQG